jgi:hypothetical protein
VPCPWPRAGTLTVTSEEQPHQGASLRLKLRGENFPSCQPFIRVSRTREMTGGALEKTPVFKTEVGAEDEIWSSASYVRGTQMAGGRTFR